MTGTGRGGLQMVGAAQWLAWRVVCTGMGSMSGTHGIMLLMPARSGRFLFAARGVRVAKRSEANVSSTLRRYSKAEERS